MEQKTRVKRSFGKTLGAQFMTGLLAILPLGISIWILVWVFNTIDDILQPVIFKIWDKNLPGVGFGVTIVLIFLIGLFARNVIGHRIIRWFDGLLNKVPVFRLLYRSLRQITTSLSVADNTGFMQVVLVDFPYKGMKAVAFITNEIVHPDGSKSYSVLIPTAPNPTTGFLEILKEEDITRTKITVDEAVKMIISAGRVMPPDVRKTLKCQ
jgi:uncharacterized membrane protein